MKEKIEFQSVVAETLLIPLYMAAKETGSGTPCCTTPKRTAGARIEYDYGQFDKAW